MDNRLPDYLRNEILRIKTKKDILKISKVIKEKELNTVCSSSRCPNLNLCFSNKTATFLLLGDKCTRRCPFCNIAHIEEYCPVDFSEPQKVACAVKSLELKHVVITMVTRDDLEDGGASIVVGTVKSVLADTECRSVEVLTSDFNGNEIALAGVVNSGVNIFGHNIETIERLYKTIRPSSSYRRSLNILKTAKAQNPDIITKSGIMVGLGESDDEVLRTIDDLVAMKIDFITIGQYLRPSLQNTEVQRYVPLKKFIEYKDYAKEKGIKNVFSAPLVRSSFGAEKLFKHSL